MIIVITPETITLLLIILLIVAAVVGVGILGRTAAAGYVILTVLLGSVGMVIAQIAGAFS